MVAKTALGVIIGGRFNNIPPALSDGQEVAAQFDSQGRLIVAASVTIAAPTGSFTDQSGTIAAGGVSQQLAAVNPNRQYLLIQNPAVWSGASESIFIDFTSAAGVNDGDSIELAPGEKYLMEGPGFISTEQVNIIATTTGHPFIAKEA